MKTPITTEESKKRGTVHTEREIGELITPLVLDELL
jgi:hypothetical protein